MGLLGSILGDIAGSRFEYDRCETIPDEKELFTEECFFTDDTVMSLAVKYAIIKNIPYQETLRSVGQRYPVCGYGNTFFEWMFCTNPHPYNSFGNGAAMRISFIGEYFDDLEDVISEAKKATVITHNHDEGIKGAVTVAVCVWMAKKGKTKEEIYEYMLSQYPEESYRFSNKPLGYLIKNYSWDVTCMTSVPIALRCFYESDSYISFLKNVLALDCDCDTLCAIGGGIAEEYYKKTGFKDEILLEYFLDDYLLSIYRL